MGTKRERLLQKLNPKFLKMTPKLSGDAGSFVDLDSEDSLEEGAKKLMMRFFRNQDMCDKNRRNSGLDQTEVTISSAKYNENEEICELITERLTLPFAKSDDDDISEKPGRRLQKLKTELKEKMSAKWEEEYKKRIGEMKEFERKHKHRKKKSTSSGEEESESESEEEEEKEEEGEDDAKELEEDYDVGDEADVESEDEGNGSDIVNREKEDSKQKTPEKVDFLDEYETLSLVPAYQPGGGLLYGGSELTQADEGLPQDLLSPSLRFTVTESPGSKVQSQLQSFDDSTPKKTELIPTEDGNNSSVKKKNLFSQNLNSSFDLNDAFEFCSGKFPDAPESEDIPEESPEPKCGAEDEEDEDKSEFLDDDEEEEEKEDENDESDNVEEDYLPEESSKTVPKNRKNIITFEDSDEEEEKEKAGEDEQCEEESYTGPQNLLSDDEDEEAVEETSKPKKKNRKTLHFSDEEDGEGQSNEEEEEEEGEEEEDDDEEEEEERDDRSIQYDSEENEIVNPKEFFEKEAELSGSEWSGDEDERGLDELEVEEGDGENLDNNEVRSQLEKIHIRRVLDDDAREVRYIQEILFEDGDLHSDGKRRDRKFKWKNLGTFDEQGNDGEQKDAGGNTSDDDCAEEEEQRKLRYEKELFLMTKKKDGDESSDEEVTGDFEMVKVRRVRTSTKALNSIDALNSIAEMAKNSLLSNTRGSFLTRNEEFLSRLARATSSVTENVSGPKHCRNFVFASKSPEKSNGERSGGCKRQVEESSGCGREEKRTKILGGEVETGPSILDLLV